ncbi:MAG: hypothetical protein BAJATHORv1_50206 [Candidatus Thorarchaeota archaeon]|nr:MAG: hypothetical protein BAJATHORv1_50206 [Candidatus Thorarchaeota archaeon]
MKQAVQIVPLESENEAIIRSLVWQRRCNYLVLVHDHELRELALNIKGEFDSLADTTTCQVQPFDYHDILANLLEIALIYRDYDLHFSPCTKNQIMVVAFSMAAQFSNSRLHLLSQQSTHSKLPVQILDLTLVTRQKLTEPKKNILKQLLDECGGHVKSLRELGTRAELAASSISEHIRDLIEAGYVQVKRTGRTKTTWITQLGKVILRIAQQWQDNDMTWDAKRFHQIC